MRLWKTDHVEGDPPKDPEIQRWFRALGPPPTGQAPPDLRAKVLARIEEHRARRGVFAWVPSLGSPAWAALALVLVVSLGLNVWWGIRRFEPASETVAGDFGPAGRLRTYRFQLGMAPTKALQSVIAARPERWDPTPVVGFTPQAARPAFFRMGALYANTVAALRGGALEAAGQRLEVLTRALTSVQAPPALPQYLRAVHTSLQQRQYGHELLVQFLALFEPLYEDAYATAGNEEAVTLFRAGTWVENLALAAAVGDGAAVRRAGQEIEAVHHALAQVQAPREALEALDRLRPLVGRQALAERELHVVRTLVQDIQGMLSE